MGMYISRHRTDTAPKRASESDAEFFERIAGPFCDQVRDVINEWWSHFPPDTRPGLRSRLRDRNSDANVFSALWELYVHEMLLGSGYTVEIEQQIGTEGKYPDFLVTRATSNSLSRRSGQPRIWTQPGAARSRLRWRTQSTAFRAQTSTCHTRLTTSARPRRRKSG